MERGIVGKRGKGKAKKRENNDNESYLRNME